MSYLCASTSLVFHHLHSWQEEVQQHFCKPGRSSRPVSVQLLGLGLVLNGWDRGMFWSSYRSTQIYCYCRRTLWGNQKRPSRVFNACSVITYLANVLYITQLRFWHKWKTASRKCKSCCELDFFLPQNFWRSHHPFLIPYLKMLIKTERWKMSDIQQ